MNGSDHGGRTAISATGSSTTTEDETLVANTPATGRTPSPGPPPSVVPAVSSSSGAALPSSTTAPSEGGAVSAAAVTIPEEPATPTTPPQQPPPPHLPPPSRRSARVLDRDPVVAPGFGTRKDVQRLSQQLSTHLPFPPEAVLELMSTRGRGLRSASSSHQDTDNSKGDGSGASGKTSATGGDASSASPWADFMNEEGVTAARGSGSSAAKAGGIDAAPSSSNKRVTSSDAAVNRGSAPSKKPAASISNKRQKTSNATGLLVQTGTLDWTLVGRGSLKKGGAAVPAHHLTVPTVILPSVQIARVFTAGHAVHSIALDGNGVPYGWGRNESHQLGSHLPANVAAPTRLFDGMPSSSAAAIPSSPIAAAAMGKGHTLLLTKEGKVWAVGSNKAGQCSVFKAGDSVPNWKACTVPDNVTIAQIACGEDFSAALDAGGVLHTAGSSEYGQLGNGETGEYFVAANKLAFANCAQFTPRRTFVHAPAEKLHTSNEVCKTVPLEDSTSIVLASIACGKHHAIAVEKVDDSSDDDDAKNPRVFSWGCGNYGCLGHGLQADEYYPRKIGLFATLPHLAERGEDVRVSAGASCSLLQTAAGHVYYWGKHRSAGEGTMRPSLVDALANNEHVVTHCAAGGQTVVCCTSLHQCVAWGQGPHGELGLGDKKSSAKPTFVTALDGKPVLDLACGYGHTLFVVEAAKDMPHITQEDVEHLDDMWSKKGK